MSDGPKVDRRVVQSTAPPFAYACGDPMPPGVPANLCAIECPSCTEKRLREAQQKKERAGHGR